MAVKEAPSGVWDQINDIHLPVDSDENSGFLLFPGGVSPADPAMQLRLRQLRNSANFALAQVEGASDTTFHDGDVKFRVHRQRTIDGNLLMLRKTGKQVLPFQQLGLKAEIRELLTSRKLNGGLVIFAGASGAGKSTTQAAFIKERVVQFGSYAVTVENPVEFDLQGHYESETDHRGVIVQIPSSDATIEADLKDVLRCYPSNMSGSILGIGEVRDSVEAAQALQMSVNGLLVCFTFHADNAPDALHRFVSYAGKVLGTDHARQLLAHSLRAVVHQRLVRGVLEAKVITSTDAKTAVASLISQGKFNQLQLDA